MEERILTCTGCPTGCRLRAQIENGTVTEVTGFCCRRGETYAKLHAADSDGDDSLPVNAWWRP